MHYGPGDSDIERFGVMWLTVTRWMGPFCEIEREIVPRWPMTRAELEPVAVQISTIFLSISLDLDGVICMQYVSLDYPAVILWFAIQSAERLAPKSSEAGTPFTCFPIVSRNNVQSSRLIRFGKLKVMIRDVSRSS